MNPIKFAQMMRYLTRAKNVDPNLPKVTTADKIPIPPKKQTVEEMEAINEFVRRNPRVEKAGGGMLVQPSADGSRPGYARPNFNPDPDRLEALNAAAQKFGYKNWDSVPYTKKRGGKRAYGDREKILQDATRRQQGIPEGKGSPGKPRPVGEDFVSPMKDPKVVEEVIKTRKKNYQASPEGKRLQWIADNAKKYEDPNKFMAAYEKHFNHKIGSKEDALFYITKKPGIRGGAGSATGKKINFGYVDGIQNFNVSERGNLMFITKGFSEPELFKAAIIQNNPKVQKKFLQLFKDINDNVGIYAEIGPEGIVERLRNKGGGLLVDFDFINPERFGSQDYGGIGKGITRNSLINLGVDPKHLVSYQNVRQPLRPLIEIIKNLSNKSFRQKYKIGAGTAQKIIGQLNNFVSGQKEVRSIVDKINYSLGDKKFNQIFGGVNFEHTLAKRFGQDYKYLPRNYLLKGNFTTQAFNLIKRNNFDVPLINLLKDYEKGKVSGQEIKNFIDDFNAKTNNYADFTFDVDKGKLVYTDNALSYDLSRYADPGTANRELARNIQLTMSDEFQKGFKGVKGIEDQLKKFKSKEAKSILNTIQSYSKLSKCKVSFNADGGRIGFALSDECIRDGLKEQKLAASKGDTRAAKQLVEVAKVSTRVKLLKNILGPGAILGEAVFEGAIIGNKVLGGKPLNQAWAESYLSYLDPRKYSGELDPNLIERNRMLTRKIEDVDGSIKTVDAPYSSILKSGFAAEDQLSALEDAIEKRNLASRAGQNIMYAPAAADVREQAARANLSEDIISSEAFKDASKIAQEYLQGEEGKKMADFGVISVPQGTDADLMRRTKAMSEMKDLYTQYSDEDILNILKEYNIDPKDYDYTTTPKTVEGKPIFPAAMDVKPVTGFDLIRDFYQQEEARQNIADAGGVANLAGGGIAKIAGVDSGPPPESGPMSQGLQGLMKRGIKG
jgi:hypothetical protein